MEKGFVPAVVRRVPVPEINGNKTMPFWKKNDAHHMRCGQFSILVDLAFELAAGIQQTLLL